MDASLETIDIMLSPDESNPYATLKDETKGDEIPSSRLERRYEGSLEAPQVEGDKKPAGRHVRSRGNKTQRQAMVHPIFRQSPGSGRAGDVGKLDDRIAKHGGTTSSYEELPHRLKISKEHRPMTPAERVVELTKTNGFLLQELAYHKDTRAAEMKFLHEATKLRADMEATLVAFDRALEERSKARADAESILLNYWGIDLGDGNIEDSVF